MMRRSKSQQSNYLPVSRSNSVASLDDKPPKRSWSRAVVLILGLAAGIYTVANLVKLNLKQQHAEADWPWDAHEVHGQGHGQQHGAQGTHHWDAHKWDSHHHTVPEVHTQHGQHGQQQQGGQHDAAHHGVHTDDWLGHGDWHDDGEWNNAYDDHHMHAAGHHDVDGWDAHAGDAGGHEEGGQHGHHYGRDHDTHSMHIHDGGVRHYEDHDEHWDVEHHYEHHDEQYWQEQHADLHAQLEHQAHAQQQQGQQHGGQQQQLGQGAADHQQFVPDPLADATHLNSPHAPVRDVDPHAFKPGGLYSMSAVDVDGHPRDLAEYAGMVTMVVNVASQCGFTDENYKGLKAVHDKYSPHGFAIMAFPCNQFGNQEPGTNAEIKHFCEQTYHTHWTTFSKLEVNGPSAHPIYQFLKRHLPAHQGGGGGRGPGQDLGWNFQKILVDRNGFPVKLHTQAFDQVEIEHDIYNLLVGNPLDP